MNESENIESHQDHQDPGAKGIGILFTAFKNQAAQAEMFPITILRREVPQDDGGDGKRGDSEGDQRKPWKPVKLLEQSQIQTSLLEKALGVKDEKESKNYI